MKIIKFENTGCPNCEKAKLLINGLEANDIVVSAMPYIEADDAVLAGKLKQPLMAFPTFVIFDEEGNEVEGKRMDGFDPNRASELVELIEFIRESK
jgi:thiol-disulfide isomerase/thioredoxin